MSDLVENPEDRFSHNEAHMSNEYFSFQIAKDESVSYNPYSWNIVSPSYCNSNTPRLIEPMFKEIVLYQTTKSQF